MAMYSIFLLLTVTSSKVTFPNVFVPEMTLFKRLAQVSGIGSYSSGSLQIVLVLGCGEKDLGQIEKKYRAEFGQSIVNHKYVPQDEPQGTAYTVTFSPKSLGVLRPAEGSARAGGLSSRSLISRAFSKELRDGRVMPDELLQSCSYSFTPWISDALQRTETIQGTFTVWSKGSTRNVPFFFDAD